jgi:hypothetical protein
LTLAKIPIEESLLATSFKESGVMFSASFRPVARAISDAL